MRAACAGLLLTTLANCIDFVAPDLPELGAPAVLQATLHLENTRSLRLDGRLAPGLDEGGLRRQLRDPAIRLQGASITPDTVLANATHVYAHTLELSLAPEDAVSFRGPEVEQVSAPPPQLQWHVVRRPGGDTLQLSVAGELALPLTLPAIPSTPAPDLRQWVVGLTGEGGASFTITANGAPPDTIRIPAQFVPASTNGTVNVRFTELQSIQLRPAPGDYVSLITLDNTIRWIVRP